MRPAAEARPVLPIAAGGGPSGGGSSLEPCSAESRPSRSPRASEPSTESDFQAVEGNLRERIESIGRGSTVLEIGILRVAEEKSQHALIPRRVRTVEDRLTLAIRGGRAYVVAG